MILPTALIMVLSVTEQEQAVVEAMRGGACGYLSGACGYLSKKASLDGVAEPA